MVTDIGELRCVRRKVAAILAGGLVVSTGVLPTLASGEESQMAAVRVSASVFDLQGSVDGAVFTDHLGTEEAPVALLGGGAGTPSLSPDDRVYVPFAVRLARGANYGARVTLRPVGRVGGVLSQMSVYQTGTFGCSSKVDLKAATLILDDTNARTSATFALHKPDGGADGAPVSLCFVAVARSDVGQGEVGAVSWSLEGESIPS